MSESKLSRWCEKTWILFGLCITALMTILVLVNWNTWDFKLKALATITALIPVHATEEWIFPGGFHFQYNSVFKSDCPDCYPMNRLSDMITVLGTDIMYAVIVLYFAITGKDVPVGALIGATAFSFLEVFFHTFCGIRAFFKYRKQGKSTIYGSGSMTAYLGFLVLGILMLFTILDSTITSADWIFCAAILGITVCFCFIPEAVTKKKDTPYFFKTNGYYDRYVK